MAKNTIRISNCTFTISSDDDAQYMESVVSKVDRKVKRLSDEMPSRNLTEIALFVAIDYCDQYLKYKEDSNRLRVQIKEYLEETKELTKKLEEVEAENELLKSELATLRNRLAANDTPVVPAVSKAKEEEKVTAPVAKAVSVAKTAPAVKASKKKVEAVPVQGFFSDDAFEESADATAEIMSFFEQKAFDDDDED